MNGLTGIDGSLYLAGNALQVHAVGMQVTAHNVANVSTDDFIPQRATYATGHAGNGVELESVRSQETSLGRRSSVMDEAGRPSGTELAKEFPQMIATQRAFEANAAVIRTAEDMSGTLLNIVA